MLDIYSELQKQVILTSTLKSEEYKSDKYHGKAKVNAIDYSNHSDCRILSDQFNIEFQKLIKGFDGIVF